MNRLLNGVELTQAEEKTLVWLAGWEESTVDNPFIGHRKGSLDTGR